jgi:hypothetical protein
LFREARYLLAEETDIREPAIYHSVLAAIASGNTTNGCTAGYIGRRSDELSHPLTMLEDAALIVREPDLFRGGRATYRITEPLITFCEAVMRRRRPEPELGLADAIWPTAQRTFSAQVAGPHFEAICRSFATLAGGRLFGELPAEVGHGTINDSAERAQIQVDVAVFAAPAPDSPQRILGLGEAKWGEAMGLRHLARLARARDLLAAKKYDTCTTVLACYSAAGFDQDLRDQAARAQERPSHLHLVTARRTRNPPYAGSLARMCV